MEHLPNKIVPVIMWCKSCKQHSSSNLLSLEIFLTEICRHVGLPRVENVLLKVADTRFNPYMLEKWTDHQIWQMIHFHEYNFWMKIWKLIRWSWKIGSEFHHIQIVVMLFSQLANGMLMSVSSLGLISICLANINKFFSQQCCYTEYWHGWDDLQPHA